MMGDYKLNTHVHVVEIDDKGARTGRDATFGPDDDLSKPENTWALKSISNPDVWEGKAPPTPEPATPLAGGGQDQVAALKARIAELEAAQNSGDRQGPGDIEVPPMRGPGSGAAEWRTYARSQQVEVADDASRDDVVNALTAAGKPITR